MLLFACAQQEGPPEVFRPTDGSIAYDVDNDGFADVGMYQRPDGGSGEFRVYFGGPDGLDEGRFASLGLGVTFGNASWVGDIDGDGNADAAVTEETLGSGPNVTLIYGAADRNLEQRSVRCDEGVAPEEESGARALRVGDVTGDGIDDLFVRSGGGRICVWAGGARLDSDAPSFFFQPPTGSGPAPGLTGLFRGVGDVTGDGIADVWVGVDVVVGGPDPFAAERVTVPVPPFQGAGDYNGDGATDLLGGGSSNRDLIHQLSLSGPGGLGPATQYLVDPGTTTITTESEFADLGDIDGDGLGDGAYAIPFRDQSGLDLSTEGHLVVFYGRENGLIGRAANSGSDRYAPKHNFLPSADLNGFRPGFAFGLGDINGDGYGDLGVENQSGGLAWYFGKGSGVSGSKADGYVVFNRTAPRMAVTGAGAI